MIKFNGTYTLINKESGTHRTFKVHTQKQTANFAPGSRIISMMTGNDNEHDYTGIGFINDNGTVNIWKKHRETQMEKLALFAVKTIENGHSGIDVEVSKKCRVCNRKLTTPESLESGIGPVCEGR